MKFSAVILAGGRSRRMGRDKAWLEVEGQPLLARQLALARAAGVQEVMISGRPDTDYGCFGCPVLLDQRPGCGPLGGIERALAIANHKLVLVLAVDLPFLTEQLLQRLLGECTEQTGVVPSCAETLEPLVAVYPAGAHSLARAQLEAGRYAVWEFAERCAEDGWIRFVPVAEGMREFTNWNRPELSGNADPLPGG